MPLLGDDPPGYGAASFWRSPTEGATAEFSITVADAWQDQGVGTLLLATLWRHALSIGIRQFIGHVLPSNLPMRSWMESLGASAIHDERQWTYHLQLDTDLLNESSASTRLRQVLASVPSLGEH